MNRQINKLAAIGAMSVWLLPLAAAFGGLFAGTFTDGKLTAQWIDSQAGYSGTISLGQQQFPATAAADGPALSGTFQAGANSFPFRGKLDGDTLTFQTGGATYTLKRQTEAVNPLAAGPTNQAAGTIPPGYSMVLTTDAGRSMATHKPDATTVTMALQQTLPDLMHYFDAKPTIVKAYEDTQDQSSGGVSFTATLKGQPVNGLVSAKLDPGKGAAIAVLYCNANATPADWNKLTGPSGGAAAGAASGAQIALQTFTFPDGTGSIGLAQGWTTSASSCNGLVQIAGPADQVITLGFGAEVVTPDSMAVRMNQQLNANAQRMGGAPIPLGLLVSPYGDPVDVLSKLAPQLSAQIQQRGGASFVLDHLTEVRKIPPMMQGGQAALARYGVTINDPAGQKHDQVLARVELMPIGNGTFSFFFCSAASPDSTYEKDLPTMLAIMNSLRENAAVIQGQTQQQIAGMNQRFAAQQQAQQEKQAAFDDYIKDIQHNQLLTERSNTDFDEVIRGVRDVEDTATGDRTSVNLGDVDQIVDNLNQAQPGRYKEIPLRDEEYPLPGQ